MVCVRALQNDRCISDEFGDAVDSSVYGLTMKGATTAGEAHRTAVRFDDARELALGAAVRRAEATMQPEEVACLRHMNTAAREE